MEFTKNGETLTKPHQTKENPVIENNNDNISEDKIKHILVARHSERETSRYLAAICDLLFQSLKRDFNIESPKTISIEALDQGGVQIKING
ncbi:MAG: hypothetical protein ACFFDP_10845 [Promethearchaeota archaeon]